MFGRSIPLLIAVLSVAVARPASPEDFTVVIFGDTQSYSANASLEPVFENMIDFLIGNAAAENIALVIQVGDIISAGGGDEVTTATTEEWGRFNSQWKRLDGVIPYAIVRGNHDNTQEFRIHYGPTPLGEFPHYLTTHPGEDDDAHAWISDLGGQDALVLGISCNPSAAELGWAQGLLDQNPDLPAIIASHGITSNGGVHAFSSAPQAACSGNPGKSVWEELVVPNSRQVFMTASGHFIVPEKGFKGMRETDGALVLDTFQNWQGGASANGCMTLVRFRPALAEVEVQAFCTELNGGAGGFLDAPGETTLPTVLLDNPCLTFSLFDGTGPPPVQCRPPRDPTISFNDDAVVPHVLGFGPVSVSSGSLLSLSSSSVLDETEIIGSLLLEEDEVFSGGLEDIDAAHLRSDGQVIFSTITSSFIGGTIFAAGDLVLHDPATGTTSRFFDGGNFADTADVDAFFLFEKGPHEGKLLLSTSAVANLGGLVFDPGDLVLYDPVADTATLFFSQALITGTAAQKNVDAVHVLPDGHLLLSTARGNGTLGGLTLREQDIVEYDPEAGTASVFLDGDALFNGTTANLNAFTFAFALPAAVPALSPAALVVLALALGVAALRLPSRQPRGLRR